MPSSGTHIRPAWVLVLVLSTLVAKPQGGCPNSGFENGDLTGWSGWTGACCPIACSAPGIVVGRHTIMTGPGTDPNTNGAVPVVCPGGGNYSVRLGNEQVGAQAERLAYSMQVDANNALFVYRYAVVLEDPDHPAEDQPRFEIRMFDEANTPIACGMYNVYSTAGIPGFVTVMGPNDAQVHYKNWTTVGMDLTGYVGQTVTIEFSVGDCAQGGHFGYAYIDTYCSPLAISSDFCPGSSSTTLEAPVGFSSYLWSTGETTPNITIEEPSTGMQFSCVLTSVTGCSVTLTTMLTPNIMAGAYAQIGNCMNAVQFTDNSVVTSGPPIYAWNWDFGDGTTSTEQDPSHQFTSPGDHEVQLVVMNDPECPDTITQVINLLPSPVVDFNFIAPCAGQPILLNDVTALPDPVVDRIWDLGDGSPPQTDPSLSYVYASAGTYDVSLYLEFANGCLDSLTIPIIVFPPLAVDLGPDLALCEGDQLQWNAAVPGGSYQWSEGTQTATFSPAASGEYWVEVTNADGCIGQDTVQVVFDAFPVLELADTTLCADHTLMLDALNPGAAYLWSTGATTQTIVVNGVTATYSVTVTSPGDCAITEDLQVATVPSVIVDLGTDQALCDGETATLDAGPFANATYAWSTGDTTQAITLEQNAEAWVLVGNGYCTDGDTALVAFEPLPTIVLHDTVLCAESPLLLDAGNPLCDHLWSTGDTSSFIVVTDASGIYGVIVTTTGGCQSQDEANITFVDTIGLDLGPDQQHCDGEVAVLDAGPQPGATYLWSTGSTAQSVELSSSALVMVNATNGYCDDQDTIAIDFNPLPAVHLNDTTLCEELPLMLDAGDPGSTYAWNTGATTQTITVVGASGTYAVVVTTAAGCTGSSSMEATFIDRINLDLGPDTMLCDGEMIHFSAANPNATYVWSDGSASATIDLFASAELSVHVTNGYCIGEDVISVTFYPYPEHTWIQLDTCFMDPRAIATLSASPTGTHFEWSTGDTTMEIHVHEYGTYIVTAANGPGCATTDTVTVRELCGPEVFLPNAFSPDGDGINDLFFPVGNMVSTLEFQVYDRWGERIYDHSGDGGAWDGRYGGEPVEVGVYVWKYAYRAILDLSGRAGKRKELMGHVTVVR